VRVETEFTRPTATFTDDHRLSVKLEGRPDWIDTVLAAIRKEMAKLDGVEEARR
jgi:hypothetical protein